MDVLIAEDEPLSRASLEASLRQWGYSVRVTHDGAAAWQAIQAPQAPRLVILDWMMPELDGTEVCRLLKMHPPRRLPYVILLTARGAKEDLVAGLESGADDFISKPFDRAELRARLRVGERLVALQDSVANRVVELETALRQIQQLQGLLPICSYCKRIRNDHNYWQQVEEYISTHSAARFSHGICDDCLTFTVQPELEKELRRLAADQEP